MRLLIGLLGLALVMGMSGCSEYRYSCNGKDYSEIEYRLFMKDQIKEPILRYKKSNYDSWVKGKGILIYEDVR